MSAVLERCRAERAEAVATMEAILANVGERDLVDAERAILESSRQRIGELDAQIEPLAEWDQLATRHADAVAALPAPATERRRMDGTDRPPMYRSAGEFLVDYLRANGIMERGVRDEAAAARVYQARADQTTATLTGILPTPVVGAVTSLVDANRPLITSLGGAKPLGGIPGTSFSRPKITQHTTVGSQGGAAGEKTQLPSQK